MRAEIRTIVREEVQAAVSGGTPAEYLTTAEAALVARVHEGTVRRWIREGRLADHSAGREIRVKRDQLEGVMAPGQRRAAPRKIKGGPELSPEAQAMRDLGLR